MDQQSKIIPLILAAGQGKRMQSLLPKVMHQVCGKPMLEHVLNLCKKLTLESPVVLLNPSQKSIVEYLDKNFPQVGICLQKNPRGTADAVSSFAPYFLNSPLISYSDCELLKGSPQTCDYVLILYGDVPGISSDTLEKFLRFALSKNSDLSLIGMITTDPKGYGRIVKNPQNEICKIVEERDCTPSEQKISLCNTGVFFVRLNILFELLKDISPQNSQNEYYLTDCVPIALQKKLKVDVFETLNDQEFLGVNDPDQLLQVEAIMRRTICAE